MKITRAQARSLRQTLKLAVDLAERQDVDLALPLIDIVRKELVKTSWARPEPERRARAVIVRSDTP